MVKPWKSKTFWSNLIAAVSLFMGAQYGVTITAEQTALLLTGLNLFLRAITNEPIEWT